MNKYYETYNPDGSVIVTAEGDKWKIEAFMTEEVPKKKQAEIEKLIKKSIKHLKAS